MVKLTTFAVMCEAYGGEPTVDLLRSFLNLSPAGDWLTLPTRTVLMWVDGEFNFLPEGGLDEGQDSSSTKSVNNGSPVVDAEPISAVHPSVFAESIIYSNNASHESDDLTPRTWKVPPHASKVAGDASTPFDVDSDSDIHGCCPRNPSVMEKHLKEMGLEQLCDIHDKAYMRQAVLDNVLNSRTRELIYALHKARASCDAIRERKVKKDKAFAELEKNCNEALQDLNKNPLLSDMRSEIKTLQGQVNGLHNKYGKLVPEEKK
nr:hypothetical protein [Tanacetum cinerariifolium]